MRNLAIKNCLQSILIKEIIYTSTIENRNCQFLLLYQSPPSVRDWSGILCELMGKWERGREPVGKIEFGSGKSEQRYSGKPDGVAGTPREKSTVNGQQSTDFIHDNLVVPYEVES